MMGVIYEFTKTNSPAECLEENPLELSKNPSEYHFNYEVPFLIDVSEDLLGMVSQRYRYKFVREMSHHEIKH